MRRVLLLLAVSGACSVFVGCTRNEPSVPERGPSDTITSIDMRPDAGGTMITFDSGHCRGIVKVEPGLATTTQTVTKSSSNGEPVTSTTIKLGDRELSIDGSKLRLGERVVGPLAGDVRIEVKKDGIFVDGEKKSDL
jgi:hypothetical protein